jgi:ribonuclease BN (tRNA processing enzyme)
MGLVTFLGTGGGRIVLANQTRSTGGFVINLQNKQIVVDPGPGALAHSKVFDIDPSKTDIIFSSHHHLDHCNDVNAIIDAMTFSGVNKKGILISTNEVIHGSEYSTPVLHSSYRSFLEKFHPVKSGETIQIGDISFRIIEAKHDVPAIGFILKCDKLTIGYTADTAYYSKIGSNFRDCNLLIFNVLKPLKEQWDTHLCTEDVINIVKEARPELAVITGFGERMIKANPTYQARAVQQRTGIRTIAATDGLKVSVRDYLNV